MLRDLPQVHDPNLLVGYSKAADAAIYRISDDTALIQTVDFFTPIVDDPHMFGMIAASNSLSDVYAMGGRPLTALNVAAFPSKKLEPKAIGQILRGGLDKATEAGCLIVGGHTVDSNELMYGMSVTGIVHPDKIVTNEAARPGDALILTKALGTGIITTAFKLRKLPKKGGDDQYNAAVASMALLNKRACELMVEAGAKASTDITGFGLLGHAMEFADASNVTFRIDSASCPMLEGAVELAERKVLTGADLRNRVFTKESLQVRGKVSKGLECVLYDAQTSGGLLIALPAAKADALVDRLRGSGQPRTARIGEVLPRGAHAVLVD